MNNKVFNISKKWLNDSIVNKNEYEKIYSDSIKNNENFLENTWQKDRLDKAIF